MLVVVHGAVRVGDIGRLVVWWVVAVQEGVFDPVSELAGERGGLLKNVKACRLGPAGEVRDAVGAAIQPDCLTATERDGFMP
jgi:hypothetical protein